MYEFVYIKYKFHGNANFFSIIIIVLKFLHLVMDASQNLKDILQFYD